MSEKRTPREQWRFAMSLLEAEDRADRAEVRRIEGLGEEELAAELREKGIDPEKAGAIGRETLEKSEREHGVAAAVPAPAGRVVALERARDQREARKEREKRVAWPVLLVAAAVVVVVGGIIAVAILWRGAGDDIGPDTYDALPPLKPDPEAALIAKAADLRQSAFALCAAKKWEDCLIEFDEADTLDPAGGTEKSVLEEKEKALSELRKIYGDGGGPRGGKLKPDEGR